MAVYERAYRLWTGTPTTEALRWSILPRYSLRGVFKSRLLLAYFVLCFIYPIVCAFLVYMMNNADFLTFVAQTFGGADASQLIRIDEGFFLFFLRFQTYLSFPLVVFIGPGLVSRDLANNGLPLFLSRPFTRAEYVLGKMTILGILLGAVTWLSTVLVLAMHVNFAGWQWVQENAQLAFGLVIAPWLWIVPLSLFALAVSAWVRWKAAGGAALLFVVLAGSFFGLLVSQLFGTPYGGMINMVLVIETLYASLLGAEGFSELPAPAAWFSLISFVLFSLFLLHRKLRAYLVVS